MKVATEAYDNPIMSHSTSAGWVGPYCMHACSRYIYRYIHRTSICRMLGIDVWHTLYDARGKQQPLAGKSLSQHCSVSAHCHLPPPTTLYHYGCTELYLHYSNRQHSSVQVHCGTARRLIMDLQCGHCSVQYSRQVDHGCT